MLKKTGQVAWTDVLPLPKSQRHTKETQNAGAEKAVSLAKLQKLFKIKKKKCLKVEGDKMPKSKLLFS